MNYPFDYEDRLVLAHYLSPYHDDPNGVLRAWASQFIRVSGMTGTRELLVEMTKFCPGLAGLRSTRSTVSSERRI